MEKISENVAIFYNKDCAKYGIKRHCNCHAYGDHWPQVAAPNGGLYTKYKAVAERWARENVRYLLENPTASIDCHSIGYWAQELEKAQKELM